MKYLLILSLIFSFNTFSESSHHGHHGHHGNHHGHHGHGHGHGTVEVSSMDAPPMIMSIEIFEDTMKGYNLYFKTMNFQFSPENVGYDNIMGEGHAHLYINGKKITRLYNNWYYIAELDHGHNMIKVTLNANDHSDYTMSGKVIAAETMVMVH